MLYSLPFRSNYIAAEHETLKEQIEELKSTLEHAQLQRRRKIEYDGVAEKVNTLPSREELEQYVLHPILLIAGLSLS